MPTAILDFEYESIPERIEGLEGYDRALVLLRLRRRPVASCWAKVEGGCLSRSTLERSLAPAIGLGFWDRWLAVVFDAEQRRRLHPSELKATVAICTRERPDDLRRCLSATLAMPQDGHEILVVDNNPKTDRTREVVAMFPGVRYTRENRPGLDAARNRALAEANGEVVAFVDDDAAPDAGWLSALLAQFSDPLVMCVTGLTMPIELETEAQERFEEYSGFNRGFVRRVYDVKNLNPMIAARAGAGANMAVRRCLLTEVGPFDPALDAGTLSQSGGDTEMFSRILQQGFRIVYEPGALNWHRHRRTQEELVHAIYGYGVGTYAFWTRKLVFEKEWGALRVAFIWFWRYQLRALVRSALKREGSKPIELLWAELRGCACGPWAYLKARRIAQKWKRQIES